MKNKDIQTGVEIRDDAIDRVEKNASERWKDYATQIVEWLCRNRDEFTTDAVWAMLDDKPGATHERRAMGAVMRMAGQSQWCEATDRTHLSTRPDCHRRPVRVWRSLLRGNELPPLDGPPPPLAHWERDKPIADSIAKADDVSKQLTTTTELIEQRDWLLEQLEGHQGHAPVRMVLKAYNQKWPRT